jgi:Ser/Thr protein kinase RdoA (MazF antagonist)
MNEIIQSFRIKGSPSARVRFGCGHINETYLVACDSGLSYILQKVNRSIFTEPQKLMENIAAVTDFLSSRSSDPRSTMHLVRTVEGGLFHIDESGEYWRVYDFVPSTVCLQKAQTSRDFYHSGLAFGHFQRQLASFPAGSLHEVIRDFHNTRARYAQLHAAMEKNCEGRAALCEKELAFALAREAEGGLIVDLLANGELPLRVTHNDTKLNNVLLDYDTHEPLCVIDLDTVMPGSALYDYGDSIRFGASTAAEDEKDLDKVSCSMELFRTYTEGFLAGCGGSLTPRELELLPMGAELMTLECGIRFLADYLNGDTYFHIERSGQNLDRARTQFKLVGDMESKRQLMAQIVKEASQTPV